ncbi:MAG TPA: glycosyltransferase [Candidatus Dormibacteraeota bacterium]
MPHRYLFVLWDGAGAVIAEKRVLSQLVKAGHGVTVLAPPSIEAHVRSTGATYLRDPSAPLYSSATDFPIDELAWLRDNVWIGPAKQQAAAVLDATHAARPHVLVVDSALCGALIGAEASRLPRAILGSTLYAGARDRPSNDPGRAFWDSGLSVVNEARATFGLQPVGSVLDQPEAFDRILILSITELHDPGVRLPDNVRYVGPPPDEDDDQPLDLARFALDKVVLVSFSTSQMNQAPILQRVADALAGLPVRGLVTHGPALRPTDLKLPDNVLALDFANHHAILTRAAAVITHGGHGTVMAALSHGVPVLCMPMGRDQHYVSERVRAAGAAVVIDSQSRPADIARALQLLMTESSYRVAAVRLRAAIANARARGGAVAELEALAAGRAGPA